jgi:hypothetical protein
MSSMIDDVLNQLAVGPRVRLRDLPSSGLAKMPGIYALWHDEELLYVGIARVDPKDTSNPQAAGLPGRLATYRRCRITSDFALGCTLRFVVPVLTADQLDALATGSLTQRGLQPIVQDWVWSHVTFSAVITDAATATAAERTARGVGLPGVGLPSFNPI